jgi:hypothetical protein
MNERAALPDLDTLNHEALKALIVAQHAQILWRSRQAAAAEAPVIVKKHPDRAQFVTERVIMAPPMQASRSYQSRSSIILWTGVSGSANPFCLPRPPAKSSHQGHKRYSYGRANRGKLNQAKELTSRCS